MIATTLQKPPIFLNILNIFLQYSRYIILYFCYLCSNYILAIYQTYDIEILFYILIRYQKYIRNMFWILIVWQQYIKHVLENLQLDIKNML